MTIKFDTLPRHQGWGWVLGFDLGFGQARIYITGHQAMVSPVAKFFTCILSYYTLFCLAPCHDPIFYQTWKG